MLKIMMSFKASSIEPVWYSVPGGGPSASNTLPGVWLHSQGVGLDCWALISG